MYSKIDKSILHRSKCIAQDIGKDIYTARETTALFTGVST